MSIIRKEAYFMSSTGEHKIRCLIWQDDEIIPVGIFQIAHGVSEHIGRYDEFARFLAANGFIVCGNDHLGHGKSAGSLEELSLMPKDGRVRVIDDMHKLYNIMSKRYPELPYFMFGHSIGSLCARIYVSLFGEELAGAVFCGTGEVPTSLTFLDKPFNLITDKMGADKTAKTITKLFSKVKCIGIDNPKTENDWISFNEENIKNYNNDPMCGNPFSLGKCSTILSFAVDACARDWAYKVPTQLPILLISGANDPVGLFGVGVQATCTNLETAGHSPSMILYPNARHEILNEDKDTREQVYFDILNWSFLALNSCQNIKEDKLI
ncbi:MAG: alpha/beta fold hydrolase [Acutalibacteraceae bacterium]|nr:alpha/beta hydrolase [Clostridiales bacterium]